MRRLSEKQRRILDFLHQHLEEKGYPPSIREICQACGISSTSVADYNLRILEGEGYLRRDPRLSRGIELRHPRGRAAAGPLRVPLIGAIAAGEPIPVPSSDTWQAYEAEEMLEVPQELVRGRSQVYALRVKGTSMIDALINDGDVVLLQHTQSAENGEMVAAWLKNEKEATLKRFYWEGEHIRLQPANTQMQPLYVDPEDVEIQGRVLGVIRRVEPA